jgi:hypothetical protein
MDPLILGLPQSDTVTPVAAALPPPPPPGDGRPDLLVSPSISATGKGRPFSAPAPALVPSKAEPSAPGPPSSSASSVVVGNEMEEEKKPVIRYLSGEGTSSIVLTLPSEYFLYISPMPLEQQVEAGGPISQDTTSQNQNTSSSPFLSDSTPMIESGGVPVWMAHRICGVGFGFRGGV